LIVPAPPPDYELPREVFEECRRLLESTRFMEMKTPSNFSAPPTVSISASHNRQRATVYITTPTKAPKGFAELQTFLENLPARGKAPSSPDRIEITNSFGSGIYGGELRTAKWVFEKSGTCRGTVTSGSNADGRENRTTEYELPTEVFEECRTILESTRFFDLKVRRPDFLFEASSWGIAATFNGRANSIDVYTQMPPERFARMRDFLDELPKRSKVVSSSPDPSR
jgi:hypothetical protein